MPGRGHAKEAPQKERYPFLQAGPLSGRGTQPTQAVLMISTSEMSSPLAKVR